jgi:hypothetical protein
MRLLTGLLFGMGIVWYTYPYMDKVFDPQDQPKVVMAKSDTASTAENYTI